MSIQKGSELDVLKQLTAIGLISNGRITDRSRFSLRILAKLIITILTIKLVVVLALNTRRQFDLIKQ